MTLDLFSRKVVAYRVSLKNSTYLIISTFQQAFQNRNAPQSLIFHSDQGAQYISKTLCKLLRINKLDQSFSAPSQPHDNAVMESSFSFMKREGIYRTQYSTLNYKMPDQFFAFSCDLAGVILTHHPSRLECCSPRKPGVASWGCFLIVPTSPAILERVVFSGVNLMALDL